MAIDQPERNFSCKIFTHLPNKDGQILKSATLEYGKIRTEATYKEICFDKKCMEELNLIEKANKFKNKLFKAIGVLPDGTIHIIKHNGEILESNN